MAVIAGPTRRPARGKLARRRGAILFAVPALVVYAAFLVYPAAQSFYLSLTSWNGLAPSKPFVGLANYRALIHDTTFHLAIKNTASWTVVIIVVPVVLGLALAVGLNDAFVGRTFLRTLLYAPGVLPLVGVATIWAWLYSPSDGAVNAALGTIGLHSLERPWLGSDSTALWATMVPGVWVRTGFPMLLYLAALQGIPRELYESARTDGANAWRCFWHISMPSLRDAHYIVIALGVIESLRVFDLIYAMTFGGPGRATQVMGTWMYFNAFQYYHAGYGTSIAVVITLVSVIAGLPYVIAQTRR